MWDRINVETVHLLYLAIGGFLCLFMLFSAAIKDKLYFGEANVALLVGAILGPFAAKAVNPTVWSNFDIVVLEFSRVVIIIQCFAVALELPRYYIEKHWKSLLWLVGPVVVWGWMVCSLLVWFIVPHLSFKQSMTIASCFNAIDPVMAATIVGKGRFARRVPKHVRDLLLAESASNDVTTSVCLGLSILLTRFPGTASEIAQSRLVYTIIYQVLLAGVVGFIIGWAAQKALKYSWDHDSTDRESFLVFYLMVALFCVGLGSLLGIDDVLLAFCAGYNFDKSKWWRNKTEESHVSDAINLLLNLTYFVFLGSLIPWPSFNKPALQISAWRLVTGTLLIFLLRRLPVILLLKPVIPDIKTWREALFYGHFGPVGVGAVFSAALISSEPGKTGIAGNLLKPSPEDPMQTSLWPVVTFVVFCSSIVHGSSIPLFNLGKAINTLTLTMSYSAAGEDGPAWMNRLPKITTPSSSRSKLPENDDMRDLAMDKLPPGTLPPIGMPGMFLRRQSEPDLPSDSSSVPQRRKKRQWDWAVGPGGPIDESAIQPLRRRRSIDLASSTRTRSTGTLSPSTIYKDSENQTQDGIMSETSPPGSLGESPQTRTRRGPTLAYQLGNTIIVEDKNGTVVKIYEVPSSSVSKKRDRISQPLSGIRKWAKDYFAKSTTLQPLEHERKKEDDDDDDDDDDRRIRFTHGGAGRQLTKEQLLREIQMLDPKARAEISDPQEEGSKQAENRHGDDKGIRGETNVPKQEDTVPLSSRDYPETAVERRRRQAALGISVHSDTSDTISDVPDEQGPWASGGLKPPTEAETQSETASSNSDIDDSVDPRPGSSSSGQAEGSNAPKKRKPKSCLKTPIPEVIVTPAEGQIHSPGIQEGGETSQESESDVSETGVARKGKGKGRVSFNL